TLQPPSNANDVVGEPAALYFSDEHAIDTFGVTLVEGRNFRPDEVTEFNQGTGMVSDSIIVTSALANALFPDGGAIGKQVYGIGSGNRVVTIIGIIEAMQMPWVGHPDIEQSVLVPARQVDGAFSRYLVRAPHGERDRVMTEVEAAL